MKSIIGQSAIAEITPADFAHPGLRMVKFVFCDNQPNENGQGVAEEDFDEIISSGIGTPIKMKFFGNAAGGHVGAIPIGYIKHMYKEQEGDVTKLIADATLFADEYPDEIEYLDNAYKNKKAPGISWELKYSTSIIKDGIEWLKGLVTRAATFVGHPAYGTRTAILALASNREISDEDFRTALVSIAESNDDSPNTDEQGGNNRMEEELQKLRDQITALETSVSEKDTEIAELTTKVTGLETSVAEKDTALAEFQKKELITSRTSALVEAGITLPEDPDKLATKQAWIAGLDDEAFDTYKTDLADAIASASKKKEAGASLPTSRRPLDIPRFDASADADETPTILGMRDKFKSISRVTASAESE